ncbi:TPA: replication initiation factor domain-containing protein [Streptococcus suis]
MKIKFVNSRVPELIKIEGEKHLTLSNRQLSVTICGNDNPISYKLGWCIDRITLVGNIKKTRNMDGTIRDLDSIMRTMSDTGKAGIEKCEGSGWILRDRQGENIAFVQYLDFDDSRGRIDFNPNKLGDFIQTTLKEFIDLIFDDVKFSRVDVACDIINIPNEFIDQYQIIKDVKSITYRSRGGNVETRYWGSSSSGKQVRLYNKKLERKKKGVIVADGIDTWWRFEAQLRGQTTQDWKKSVDELLSYFTSPHFIPLDITGIKKVTLKALITNPEDIKELDRNSKARYRKLISRVVENDELTEEMAVQFNQDVAKLKKELDSWLGYIDVTENDVE